VLKSNLEAQLAKNKKQHSYNAQEARMVRNIDKLSEFDDFCEKILPELRKMIKQKASAEAIYKFAESYAAARNVTIALTDDDSNRAQAAIRDILDRTQGKAKERTEHTHRLERMREEELNSLLLSKLTEASEDDDNKKIQWTSSI